MDEIRRDLMDRLERAQRENGALAAEVAALRARLDSEWPVPAPVTTAEAPPVDPDSDEALDAMAREAGFVRQPGCYGPRRWEGARGRIEISGAQVGYVWKVVFNDGRNASGPSPSRSAALAAAVAWHAGDAAKGAP